MHSEDESQLIEYSRAEKILALGMVVFMLMGGFWIMNRITRFVPRPDYYQLEQRAGLAELSERFIEAQRKLSYADSLLQERREAFERTRVEYEFRREEYRVSLEKGVADTSKEKMYEESRRAMESAMVELDAATSLRSRFAQEFSALQDAYNRAHDEINASYSRAMNVYELKLFLVRFAYVFPVFGLSYWIWQVLRAKRSRHLVLGTAFLGFSTVQAIVMSGQYAWHLVRDVAQIAVSVAGTVATGAALVALKRYVTNPERVRNQRFRKGQCPACGFGVKGELYCPSCGFLLQAACPDCRALVPVVRKYCPNCGKPSKLT